jgi:outer membrane protein insertion porin family
MNFGRYFPYYIISLMLLSNPVLGQPDNHPVVDIVYLLNGNTIHKSPLLNDLQQKTKISIGEQPSRYAIRKSIEAIYAIGEFSQVEVFQSHAPDGISIRFRLTRKIKVRQIQFAGNNRLSKDDLFKVMKSRPEKEYYEQIAKQDRQRILDLYRDDYGYLQVEVRFIPPDLQLAHEVDLLYEISEGRQSLIREIGFKGVKGLEPKKLGKVLNSKAGKAYQKRRIEEDIDAISRLYRKNGYLTVQIDPELYYDEKSDMVSLIYRVREGKKVVVKLVGDNVDSRELREKLNLFKQDSYSNTILRSNVQQIRRIYQQKGYYTPVVTCQIEKESNDEVIIRFDIHPGVVLRVGTITFTGNAAYPAAELGDKMEIQPRSRVGIIPRFGWLFPRGVFDPAIFDKDLRVLKLFYKKEGYTNVQITTEKEIDENKERVNLNINIDEGERQIIKVVSIEGNQIFEASTLLPKPAAKVGKPYSTDFVARDLQSIQSLYNKEGYIYTSIEPHYQPETGRLLYQISEGIQAKFGRFYFDGESRIKLHVLEREFENLDGTVFNLEKLVEARRRLFNLGIFREIRIQTPGQLAGEEIIDVNVDAKVRAPGSMSLSGGYSPSEGVRGTIGVTHNNIHKRNIRAGLQFRIGTRGNLYELTLVEPWFKPPIIGHTIGTLRLFEDNLEENNDIRARGVTANLAKRLGLLSNLAIQYKYQELHQSDSDKSAIVSSLGISFHWDNRDGFLNPRNGWFNEVAVEYAGEFLGGETRFLKFTTDNRFYMQIRNVVFASALRLGWLQPNRAREVVDLLSFERFWAGGSTTVRGYDERSLGPGETENPRGDVLFIFNTELRFPIYKFISGALFFDTGNVWDKLKLSEIEGNLPRSAIGVGLRIETPLGPARLDSGFQLTEEFPRRIHIELGHAF